MFAEKNSTKFEARKLFGEMKYLILRDLILQLYRRAGEGTVLNRVRKTVGKKIISGILSSIRSTFTPVQFILS